MATGDQNDFVTRIKALLPNGWFRDDTPYLDAVLGGVATALSAVYALTGYARFQTRIATATDGFLDLISFDFFGTSLLLLFPELTRRNRFRDNSFRA